MPGYIEVIDWHERTGNPRPAAAANTTSIRS